MTILIVLAGLLISHYATAVGRWRDFSWLLWPLNELRRRYPGQAWLAPVAVIVTALVFSLLATLLVTALLGLLGWALLALAVFIYTLGPRDLDRDVALILEDPEHADGREAALALGLKSGDAPGRAAASVLQASRTRWFSILFWFTVLGIPGALLYRLCEKATEVPDLTEAELDWLARMRWVMEWPVLALMLIAAGLSADLDRVHQAWKRFHRERPWWLLSPVLLDDVSAEVVDAGGSTTAGLKRGHQVVWRMLVLWLVVMSLMLLAGWLV